MKVWELMAALSKFEAGKDVEFSTLLSCENVLASYKVGDVIEIGEAVTLISE